MKLLKTKPRGRMSSGRLNDLMLVHLESPAIEDLALKRLLKNRWLILNIHSYIIILISIHSWQFELYKLPANEYYWCVSTAHAIRRSRRLDYKRTSTAATASAAAECAETNEVDDRGVGPLQSLLCKVYLYHNKLATKHSYFNVKIVTFLSIWCYWYLLDSTSQEKANKRQVHFKTFWFYNHLLI